MNPADLVLTKKGVRFKNRLIPCSIGRSGITTDKREGDGATPAGLHRIMGLYYRPDRMVRPAPWAIPIHPFDLWSDDVDDPAYNHLVHAPHAFSFEHMRRADPLYDMVLITDWNWPVATAGKGSAIFLHVWRKPHHPTEGCIAFSHPHMRWIIQHIEPQTNLIVKP